MRNMIEKELVIEKSVLNDKCVPMIASFMCTTQMTIRSIWNSDVGTDKKKYIWYIATHGQVNFHYWHDN